MIIDFHTHLLPGIDDGAADIDISKKILAKEILDNVDIIVATPHYYCDRMSIDSFINRRNNALSRLKASIPPDANIPKIIPAAEVYYSHFLNNINDVSKLCIENTDYMLLELPYRKITPDTIDRVIDFSEKNNINIILAHIERYLNYTSLKNLIPLASAGMLFQVNCDSIVNPKIRGKVFKLINKGYVYALGTDVHNTDTRMALMKESLKLIEKKFNSECVETIMNSSMSILSNNDICSVLRQ